MSQNEKETFSFLDWAKELDMAITVSDLNDDIIYMNDKSKQVFANTKIGDNLCNCHSAKSKQIIGNLKKNMQSNTYTITKNCIKKIIHQTPWYKNGEIAGLVEFSIVLPEQLAHYNRDDQKTS